MRECSVLKRWGDYFTAKQLEIQSQLGVIKVRSLMCYVLFCPRFATLLVCLSGVCG